MGEIPRVISPYVFEELKKTLGRNTCPEALTEAMKQMAGGLPEEVVRAGVSWWWWSGKSSALELCGFFGWIVYMGV